jgi:hypothetical protein
LKAKSRDRRSISIERIGNPLSAMRDCLGIFRALLQLGDQVVDVDGIGQSRWFWRNREFGIDNSARIGAGRSFFDNPSGL